MAELPPRALQLLAVPELYLSGYASDPGRVRQLAEPLDGPSLMRVAGEERFYDAIALVDATGTLLKNYCKTHLRDRSVAGRLQ